MKNPLLLLFFCSFATLAQSPLQKVEWLYGHYKQDKPGIVFDRSGAEQIISTRLMTQVEKDRALTLEGDAGFLDYDPICNCQDYNNLVLEQVETIIRDEHYAEAKVRFRAFDEEKHTITQTLMLVNENGQWLIDDIISPSGSLYQAFVESNRTMQNGSDQIQNASKNSQ